MAQRCDAAMVCCTSIATFTASASPFESHQHIGALLNGLSRLSNTCRRWRRVRLWEQAQLLLLAQSCPQVLNWELCIA